MAEQIEMNGREVLPPMLCSQSRGEGVLHSTRPVGRYAFRRMVAGQVMNAAAAACGPTFHGSEPSPLPSLPVLRPILAARPPSRWAARISATA